jgi:hypothetical protein
MMKKDLMSVPFVLGVCVVVLEVVTAAAVAVAVHCDGSVPANRMSENQACWNPNLFWCSGTNPDCDGKIVAEPRMGNFPLDRYWGLDNIGMSEGFWVRADVGGSVPCAKQVYCILYRSGGQYICGFGPDVLDDNGNIIVIYRDYYISIGCDPVAKDERKRLLPDLFASPPQQHDRHTDAV